jgi:hypothetical protein
VRDTSRDPSTPGGFGIGLGSLKVVDGERDLRGVGVEFVHERGYRVARYPEDTDLDVESARLDDQWHDVNIRLDGRGLLTMDVDGVTVVSFRGERVCGVPVIRIWGSAVELSAFATRVLQD